MSEALVDIVASLREPCADFVTTSIYDRFAGELKRFGERGKRVCRQDILYHLDYLQSALIGNDPTIFSQYALWLRDVLSSRGVPTTHLGAALDFQKTFFDGHLATADAAVIASILDAACGLLSSDEATAVYGQLTTMGIAATPEDERNFGSEGGG